MLVGLALLGLQLAPPTAAATTAPTPPIILSDHESDHESVGAGDQADSRTESVCSAALHGSCGQTRYTSALPGRQSCPACLGAHAQALKHACGSAAIAGFCGCPEAMDRLCASARQHGTEKGCLACFVAQRAAFANVSATMPLSRQCGVGKDPGEYCRLGPLPPPAPPLPPGPPPPPPPPPPAQCTCAVCPCPCLASEVRWKLAVADSMEKVLRTWTPRDAADPGGATVATLSLAKNEREALQLVVVVDRSNAAAGAAAASSPSDRDSAGVCNITWSTPTFQPPRRSDHGGVGIGGLTSKIQPIGFVHTGPCPWDAVNTSFCNATHPVYCKTGLLRDPTHTPTCVAAKPPGPKSCRGCSDGGNPQCEISAWCTAEELAVQWHPYVVLDDDQHGGNTNGTRIDVRAGEAQPLLLTVHAGNTTAAGIHESTVTVRDGHGVEQSLLLRVQVYDFALPVAQSLPSIWGWDDHRYGVFYCKHKVPHYCTVEETQPMIDFFVEHRVPLNSMYFGNVGLQNSVLSPAANTSLLAQLWERGQRWWVLSVDSHPSNTSTAISQLVNATAAAIEATTEAGWPLENTIVYIGDEIGGPLLEGLAAQSAAIKARWPEVKVVTCGRNQWARRIRHTEWPWLPQDPMDNFSAVDIFVPYTIGYENTSEATREAVRRAGQKVGWYTSGVPSGHGGLNFYVEYPAVRSRLLMGLAAWKQQSDFYIYYELGGWVSFSGPAGYTPAAAPDGLTPFMEVTDVMYTSSSYDGEALLILPGPKGMLSTIQFESLRDGLEECAPLSVVYDHSASINWLSSSF
jgi:hypothetical protein